MTIETTTSSTTKTKTRKVSRRPTLGALAIEALTEAFSAGKKTGATVRKVTARRATAVPAPEFEASQIAELREMLGLSQPVAMAAASTHLP